MNEWNLLFAHFATEQKAAERAARDQAKAEEAFHELDDDGDGVWVWDDSPFQ